MEQFKINNPSHFDGGSICPSPGPQEHHHARSQGTELVCAYIPHSSHCFPWARPGGLEGEAASQTGNNEEAENKAENQVISDVGCRTGPTGVPKVAGQAEASQISRRAQKLSLCSRAPHTHPHMHTHTPQSYHTHAQAHTHSHILSHPAEVTHTERSINMHTPRKTHTRASIYIDPPTPSSSQTHM